MASGHKLRSVIIAGAYLLVVPLLCWGILSCRSQPGRWRTLAAKTNAAGTCFIVAQEHYDTVEGWRVSLTILNSNKVYGALLQMETGPWQRVQLEEKSGIVEVLREGRLVATYHIASHILSNGLTGSSCQLNQESDGLQGQPVPHNLAFE